MTDTEGAAGISNDRQLDMESLKALAHPLRVQILDTLSTFGQFTASGLAERLGESSGATSYHLRQLEKHGFVREVAGKGTARERWWERMPGGIQLIASADGIGDTAAGKAAAKTVMRQWERNRTELLHQFTERGYEELPEWVDAGTTMTINLRLTRDQLHEITRAFEAFIDPYIARFRGQDLPGSRPTQMHFNAFPVMDAEETPLHTDKDA